MKKIPIKFLLILTTVVLSLTIVVYYYYINNSNLKNYVFQLQAQEINLNKNLNDSLNELRSLKNQDQYLLNQALMAEIHNIQTTYQEAVSVYEQLVDIPTITKKTDQLSASFAASLNLLAKRNYASASATLKALKKILHDTENQLASAKNVPVSNTAPASGYKRQNVQTSSGTFLVDIIAADLNSTRVIVDTASEGDCRNDCPVLALADYVQRSGAFAAINGPYFCPAAYPSCADKKNSFDTLLMNKNKVYFNSENNIYSVVPAVVFQGNSARFVGKSQEWGRDTGPDAVIAGQPLLVLNGEIAFYGDEEAKRASRGGRSFIAATDTTVYIGVVHAATVAEAAVVVKTLGIRNALNLDSGGSTALWSGRYIVGPGRNLPFGILLVKK